MTCGGHGRRHRALYNRALRLIKSTHTRRSRI